VTLRVLTERCGSQHGTSARRIYFSPAQAGTGYLAGFSRTLIYHRA
jgi:hypothetical protein